MSQRFNGIVDILVVGDFGRRHWNAVPEKLEAI
jgi:hypothetical protein